MGLESAELSGNGLGQFWIVLKQVLKVNKERVGKATGGMILVFFVFIVFVIVVEGIACGVLPTCQLSLGQQIGLFLVGKDILRVILRILFLAVWIVVSRNNLLLAVFRSIKYTNTKY